MVNVKIMKGLLSLVGYLLMRWFVKMPLKLYSTRTPSPSILVYSIALIMASFRLYPHEKFTHPFKLQSPFYGQLVVSKGVGQKMGKSV